MVLRKSYGTKLLDEVLTTMWLGAMGCLIPATVQETELHEYFSRNG